MTVQHTIEHMDTKPAIVPLHLWPGASPFYVPKEHEEDVIALLKEERALMFEPSEPFVRRVLDLGANVGEFALYCRMRWPYAWVDCLCGVENDDRDEALCKLNVPVGTRVLDDLPVGKYDLVRIDRSYKAIDPEYWKASIVFCDGFNAVLPKEFELKACGMRRKNEPFQWWVRS